MTFTLINFVETAEFDPAAFQLPDSLQSAKGPDVSEPLAVSPQLQVLEKQLQREITRVQHVPEQGNPQIVQNIKQQVHLSASDMRAEQVKALLLKLKSLATESDLNALRSALIANIEQLQACYAGEQVPKDLATMSVLHPLLKCQSAKWDALKASRSLEIPAPEANYLQKLRQLKGGLSPVERAALMQWVLAFNQHVPKFEVKFEAPEQHVQAEAIATEATSTLTSEVTPPESARAISSAPAALQAAFDPLQASRLLMQARAKLQRTFSTQEKQDLQAQIQTLEAQQKAFFEQKQIQALHKQIQDFQTDLTRFEQAKFSAATFESWRKLRLTSLQNILRLFAQDVSKQAFASYFESAQKQIARLGMSDATEWIHNERKVLASDLAGDSALYTALVSWQQTLGQMIDRALGFMQTLKALTQAAEFNAQLKVIEQVRTSLQSQQSQIQQLEAAYLSCEDPEQAHQLKQSVLQLYAELLSQLPKADSL